MTVQIQASGVVGDLDLSNREAGELFDLVGLKIDAIGVSLPAREVLDACDRTIGELGLALDPNPPLTRPTSDDCQVQLMGLRFIAANSDDGQVRFR